jgi:dienelactone hydrolase
VERYKGALLVAGGEQDSVWSSGHMAQNIAERRAEAGLDTVLMVFPEAGHNLSGHGWTLVSASHGGTVPANAKAQRQVWGETLSFFARNLRLGLEPRGSR